MQKLAALLPWTSARPCRITYIAHPPASSPSRRCTGCAAEEMETCADAAQQAAESSPLRRDLRPGGRGAGSKVQQWPSTACESRIQSLNTLAFLTAMVRNNLLGKQTQSGKLLNLPNRRLVNDGYWCLPRKKATLRVGLLHSAPTRAE